MAIVTTISVPNAWLRLAVRDYDVKQDNKTWVKHAVQQVLIDCILNYPEVDEIPDPEVPPNATLNLSIPEPAASIAIARSRQLGLSPGVFCKRLLARAAKRETANTAPTIPEEARPLIDFIESMGSDVLTVRYEQAIHFSQLIDALRNGRFGFCEAGTGTGKTLAMVFAAVLIAQENQARVTLTFPTIAVMFQAASMYQMIQQYVHNTPPLRIVLGRREFVSKEALLQVLAGPLELDRPKILEWIAQNAPAPVNFGFADIHWLAASLYLIDSRIPLSEVTLPELVKDTDPGFLSYRAAFNDDRDTLCELQMCSHAMIAQDIQSKIRLANRDDEYRDIDKSYFELLKQITHTPQEHNKEHLVSELNEVSALRTAHFVDLNEEKGLLPSGRYLIVDESHLFESNVSSALSEYLSVQGLLRALKGFKELGGKISARSIQDVTNYVNEFQSIDIDGGEMMSFSSSGGLKAHAICQSILDEIGHLKPSKKSDSSDFIASQLRLLRMIKTLRTACGIRTSQAYIQFSPVRQYPQLFVSKANVKYVLEKLWSLHIGIVAVSATIYLQRADGYSSTYQQMILNVPKERLREYMPVSPAWLYSTMESVHFAGKDAVGKPRLRPPTTADRLNQKEFDVREKAWLSNLALELIRIYEQSPGGVLVLMTSYTSVSYLEDQLQPLSQFLVTAQENGDNLQKQAERFLSISKSKSKAIWLALGGAWTGLDVGGHNFRGEDAIPAIEDDVLTTLVVPRLPFGTNRTITHLYRVSESPNVPWELLHMFFVLKQGIGRLIRREGLKQNRRLYLLDGRLEDPDFENITSNVKRILSGYQKQDT